MRRGSNVSMHLASTSPASSFSESPVQADISTLYRRHWHTLCAFARSKGCEPHDAEDAVQELFAKLLGQGQHERAAAIVDVGEQGAFLLSRLRTHLIKRWRHRTRLRRGGSMTCLSLSLEEGGEMDIPDCRATPDAELDRGWARGVLDNALNRMSVELRAQGRGDVWGCLEKSVVEGTRGARPLDGALRVALHRAKRRLQALIRAEMRDDEGETLLHAVLA